MSTINAGILSVIGVLIVIGVWVDFLSTAMTASKTGVFSRRLAYCAHRIFKAADSAFNSTLWREASGPCITLGLIIIWFTVSWAGWSLIYIGHYGAVVNSSTSIPAQVFETVYFVGFALTTLGTGDFVPNGDLWKIVTVITSVNGLVLVTLSITYAIPIVQAVAAKRALSCQFSLWGEDVPSVLCYLKNDREYQSLANHLDAASQQILLVSQQHLAYPVLHYFNSPVQNSSLSLQITILDEVLRQLPDEAFDRRPELHVLVPNCVMAITQFLTTLSGVFVKPSSEEPAASSASGFQGTAFELATRYSSILIPERRKLLKALIEENGWEWRCVEGRE